MRWRDYRRRTYEILEEGTAADPVSVWVDRLLIALIVVNVLSVVLETVPEIEFAYGTTLLVIEYVSVAVFTVEYALRIWVADWHLSQRGRGHWAARLRYAVRPAALIDLFAILPFYIGFVVAVGDWRYLRLFRLIRFLKLARYSPALGSLGRALASETRALIATAVIMLALTLTAASAIYVVEHAVQPDHFGSIPASMWWAITTLTTVGYGDVVPMTVIGKMIGGVVMIVGVAMFALPIGIVATAFVQEIHRRDFVVTWGMVSKVPLFAELSATQIAEVMGLLTARVVEPGDVIVRKGDPAHSMFIIATGEVEVQLPEEPVRLGEGAFFGELAAVRNARRSATVTAARRSRLLVLDSGDLAGLMRRQPGLAEHIQRVARARIKPEQIVRGGDLASEEVFAEEVEGGS